MHGRRMFRGDRVDARMQENQDTHLMNISCLWRVGDCGQPVDTGAASWQCVIVLLQ